MFSGVNYYLTQIKLGQAGGMRVRIRCLMRLPLNIYLIQIKIYR